MSDLEQTSSGDLAITNNSMIVVSGSAEISQRIAQRLRTVMGEWFLDYTVGVPYFRDIFVKNPNLEAVGAVLKNEILGTVGVTQLLEFTLDLGADRTLSVDFKVQVYNGDILTFLEELST